MAGKEQKRIKICQVASADFTLKFMLKNQLIFLKNQGYEIFGACSSGKWVKDIEKEGIRVKIIKFKRKFSPFSDLVAFFNLFFYFKREKFHIVHTHSLKPEFYGQIAAKLARVPIIINTLHGFDFSEDDSFLKKKFFIFLERIAAKCSDLIFSIGRKIIARAIKEKIGKVESFKYLGRDIDTDRFNPQRFPEKFILEKKIELGLEPNKKVIGIVARLVKEKGYFDLFEALKTVVQKFPDVMLMVIGPEEPEKKDAFSYDIIKNYNIEKNVIFLGERNDVDDLYALMDIFVLPTHREGLGAAILEASAMEKPVIATDIGGCPETIDDGETGILIPAKNPGKIAEALIFLLENPEKAREMGKKGRNKIIEEFSLSVVLNRMKNEYQRIIQEKIHLFK